MPHDKAEFGSFVDTLNQGASFEGVYNGFTHSSDYRQMEIENTGATPEALRTFSMLLAEFQAELPEQTQFDEKSGQPLARPVQPDGSTEVVEFRAATLPKPSPTSGPDKKALEERYLKIFVGSSIFTLKRVLGDEALKVLAVKREFPEKMAIWYSKWVIRMSEFGVDFGIAQRNNKDEQFHYQWAVSAPEDRLKWEVLNRVHRVLNEANRRKQ